MPRSQQWFWRRRTQWVLWALIALLIGWVALGGRPERSWWPFGSAAPRIAVAPDRPVQASEWTAVAAAAMPAVVNIASSRVVRRPEGAPPSPFFGDPFFRFFVPEPETAPRREQSLGSGVLVTPDGYVLTNHHVVEDSRDIRVTLADRREFRAQVVGSDPRTDLAVLKLDGDRFSILAFGNSDGVQVAEPVLAIGNPFGLSQTVTMGIVSAVGRADVGIADYEDFVQTDAAINPGNSGGALVNARGELIGINTAIFSESGGYMGIGFAVPSNMARHVMDQLVRQGRVTRGFLGVSVQDVTPALARALGLPEARGTIVTDVAPDGPAARAGLRRGDVILAVGDRAVTGAGQFRNLIAATPPGTRVRLGVRRDGREQTLDVTVGEAPEQAEAVARAGRTGRSGTGAPPAGAPGAESLGVVVADPNPETAPRDGRAAGAPGALVVGVLAGSPADGAGLRPGDVIQEVNGQPVRSTTDLRSAVEQNRGKDLALLVERGETAAYVVIEPTG